MELHGLMTANLDASELAILSVMDSERRKQEMTHAELLRRETERRRRHEDMLDRIEGDIWRW